MSSMDRSQHHVVENGDTLTSLSVKFGTTTNSLKKTNKLFDNRVYAGQILIIPNQNNLNQSNNNSIKLEPPSEPVPVETKSIEIVINSESSTSSTNPSFSISPIISMSNGFFNSIFGNTIAAFNNPFNEPPEEEVNNNSPIKPYNPKIIGDNTILTHDYLKQLIERIPHSLRANDWILLYSMLGNGTELNTFYRRTISHQNTILFIQTLDGDIFGGFNDHKWQVSSTFCKDYEYICYF